MSSALVTGASGFIGGRLVAALVQRGLQVRCLVRRSSKTEDLDPLDVELVYGDITDASAVAAAVQGMDVVYHLAGMRMAVRRRDLMRVNPQGAEAVSRAAASQPQPPVVVHVSSVAAAGPVRCGGVRREADPPNPISNYGLSKRLAERQALRFAPLTPTTIVRPGIVFGPNNRELLPLFESIGHWDLHVLPGLRTPPLSMIYIDDLCELLMRCAEQGKRVTNVAETPGQGVYFGCAPEYPTYSQLGRWISRILERPLLCRVAIPLPLTYMLAAVVQFVNGCLGQAHEFNLDKIREASVCSWACSSAAVEQDLGWTPPHSLHERLRQTAEWYREHGWL